MSDEEFWYQLEPEGIILEEGTTPTCRGCRSQQGRALRWGSVITVWRCLKCGKVFEIIIN
jgi:ribosomal protein L37AE/L43A